MSADYENYGKELLDIMDENIVFGSEDPMEPIFDQELSSDNKSLTNESQTGNTIQTHPDGLGLSF